jgi:mRNA interferase RelE/StbE
VPYQLDVSPTAQAEIKRVPGHVRQRVRRAITALAQDPRPPRSDTLEFPLSNAEPRRLRLDRWRIVYAVIETPGINLVAVVAVRKRPPYDYDDLPDLFSNL